MSKFKTSKFKKRIWGCSESLKGLGSKNSVSQTVVDNVSDMQCFTHFDTMRQQDSSASICLASDGSAVVGCENEKTYSGDCSSINTRYFYSTAVDKKRIQGLLAHGKKATVVAKQSVKPMKVNTRVFVPRLEPRSFNTNPSVHCGQHRDSVKGVADCDTFQSSVNPPSLVVGQDNENHVPIVSAEVESRTSDQDNGGGNNDFAMDTTYTMISKCH